MRFRDDVVSDQVVLHEILSRTNDARCSYAWPNDRLPFNLASIEHRIYMVHWRLCVA